ncbi:MAG: hypothetical protein R6W96_04490 [Clostridia bacterium]
MKKASLVVAAVLLLTLMLSGCGKTETEMGWGEYKNGVYTNEYFGYSIHIDESYHYLSPEEIINMDADTYEEDEEWEPFDINDIEDMKSEPILYYLYAFKYPRDSEQDVNANLSFFSENLNFISGVTTKEAYTSTKMDYVRQIFQGTDYLVSIEKVQKVWINDREYAKGRLSLNFDGVVIVQELFVIVRKNQALVTMINYATEEERQELDSFVQTIKVKN